MPSRRRSKSHNPNPLESQQSDQPDGFEDLAQLFRRIESGEGDNREVEASLSSLSAKYGIPSAAAPDPSQTRPRTTQQQNRRKAKAKSSSITSATPNPNSSSAKISPKPRPSTVSSTPTNSRLRQNVSPPKSHSKYSSPAPSQNALDLFEEDAPTVTAPPSSRGSDDSPTIHSDSSLSSPTSRSNPRSNVSVSTSPLPPILKNQLVNKLKNMSNDDRYTEEFYSDILNADVNDLYKTLGKRAKTAVASTRRASTGIIVPNISSTAQMDDPHNLFNTFTHTLAEARILKTSQGPRNANSPAKKKRISPYATTTSPQRASTAAIPTRTKKIDSYIPTSTFTIPSNPLFSSTFEPRSLLGNRASSPYHEINDKSLFPPRAATVGLGAKRRNNTVVELTTRLMRKEGRKLEGERKEAIADENAIFYSEVQKVAIYRKDLPLSFLSSKLLANGKGKKKGRKPRSSFDSVTSEASSVLVEMDAADIEIMKLACQKVVDGFMRMIIIYFGKAWKMLINQREWSRHEERVKKATKIQCWFRGLWAVLGVKREKEQMMKDEKDRIENERLAELNRNQKARQIQSVARGFVARCRHLYLIEKVNATKAIQRAWSRKRVIDKGMSEVGNYYLLQDTATSLQCFYRSYRSRLIVAHLKRKHRHKILHKRYETPGAVIRTNFEMHGAASKIQRWFRRLPYRLRVMIFKFRLQLALKIQRWYRHMKAKNSTIVKLLGFRGEILKRENAALIIQPIVRGGTVRLIKERIKREKDAIRQSEIEHIRMMQKKAHEEERARRHSAVNVNKGFFSRFKQTAALGGHLAELNPMTLQKHKQAAIVIQKHARRYLVRFILKQKEDEQMHRAAARMQKKFKLYTFRKARWKATLALEMLWMKIQRRRRKKHKLVTRVQSLYRGRMGRRRVIGLKILWNPTAKIIQKIARGFIAKIRVERSAQDIYWVAEFKMNGKISYHNTFTSEVQRQIFHHSTHFMRTSHKAELQCLFSHYCSVGQRGNTDRLGVNMFIKFIKESDLISKQMTQQTFELMFTHEKGHETHLHYPQFLKALRSIASSLYPKIYNHGKFKGNNAQLMKLLQQKVLCTSSAKTHIKVLGDSKADKRAKRWIEECTERIQKEWKACKRRADQDSKFLSHERAMHGAKKLWALSVIQRVWRNALSRAQLRRLALRMYQKIVDEHHGNQVYYYNVKTGAAMWKKPVFLGRYDIANPIKLPTDDRIFKKTCDLCAKVASTFYDINDNESFCDDCHEQVHSKGRRQTNICVKIDNCIQCEFQVASKSCVQCKDLYCDTCYFDQHKKGMLQKHYFDEVQSHCVVCRQYVALLKVDDGSGEELNYCKVCYKKEHPYDPKFQQDNVNNGGVSVRDYIHQPAAVHAYWEKKAEDERRAILEAEFQERKKELDVIIRRKSAQLIQKHYRGLKGRRKGAIIMASRRQAKLQRKKDEAKRQKMSYQLRLIWGNAPVLPSDTLREKVVKRYPSRWNNLLEDIVDNEWEGAFKLIDQHDKFLKLAKEDVSRIKKLKENSVIVFHLMIVMNQSRRVEGLARKKDKAQMAYRNARSAVGFDAKKKEELKMNMRKTKHLHMQGEEKLEKLRKKLKTKRDMISLRKGPNGFAKFVKERRQSGVKMKWKNKPIEWRLERFKDYVHAEDSRVNPFKNKKVAFGRIVRLGDMEKFGKRFYSIKTPIVKITAIQRLKDRINQVVDPESQRDVVNARKEAAEDWNQKWMKLNRAWMHPLEENEEVTIENLHLMPRELWGARMKYKFKQLGWNNPFSQFLVRRMFRFLGKLCNLLDDIARRFDDDSSTNAYLQLKVANLRKTQYKFLMRSNRLIEERQRGAKAHAMNKYLDKISNLKTQITRELKTIYEQLTTKKKKVEVDPFSKWDESTDKVEVNVMWWNIAGKDEMLGVISMDADAPANVGREYCRRFVRDELNAKCGELFLMVAKGEGLPLLEESTKRIGQLAPQKFNQEAKEVQYTLLLTENKDPNLDKRQIPVIKSEALKAAEKEMEKKKAGSLVVDEKKYKEIEMDGDSKNELRKELIMAGVKEKKVDSIFNRNGSLIPMSFNDMTKRMEVVRRVNMKKLIDVCTGEDTQGDHNFAIDDVMIKEFEEKARNALTDEEEEEKREKEAMLKRKEEEEERALRRAEMKRQAELDEEEEEEGKEKAKAEEEKKVAEDLKRGGGEKVKVEVKEEEEEDDVWEIMGDGGDGVVGGGGGGGDDAAAAWAEYYDDQGNVYYYNSVTEVSQYDYPQEWQ
ncbi:hypothetical protein TrLO_g250 [Triparma laevis f. longispina]|uniref:WW domain-containing protein n=1 Tax=Triparma laevis f. longispina TaxID=1714387 RepID=A0A9W7F7U7_9STRA|nr:hypothetical protein TrLO_g250 [Triparma laevis f. longispina]